MSANLVMSHLLHHNSIIILTALAFPSLDPFAVTERSKQPAVIFLSINGTFA